MGEDIDRQELNTSCVRAVYRAWENLKPRYRPLQPNCLMRIIGDFYQYPEPDFLVGMEADALSRRVDDAFDAFAEAAANLAATTPSSAGWHVLPYILEDRFPPGTDAEDLSHLLAEAEALASRLSTVPRLPPRSASRGQPIKNRQVRILVQLICWYVDRIEGKRIKSGFKDDTGVPTSREARLIEATLAGMGLNVLPTQIKTHLDAARKLKFNGLSHWDLMSVLPPRSKTGTQAR